MGLIIADRVCESTTSTGTGSLALAGAAAGFRAFSAVCANLDTVSYEVHAVDGSGVPTGEFETGMGQFLSDGTTHSLARRVKLSGSTVGAGFVNLSAGTKRVSLTVTATQLDQAPASTEVVYYVRLDGNDANDGLANTSGSAFRTIQHAVDIGLALSSNVKIYLGAGSFLPDGFYASAQSNKPASVEVVGAGQASTTIGWVLADGNIELYISRLRLGADGSGLRADSKNTYIYANSVKFAATGAAPHAWARDGATIELDSYTIAGDAVAHVKAENRSTVIIASDIVVASNVTFSGGFAHAKSFGLVDFEAVDITITPNTVTGPRYVADSCGVIDTYGAGETALPGSTAGTKTNGGQYL